MTQFNYPAPGLSFDPNKQTYLDYINSVTGYQQPPQQMNSPFPAETAGYVPPQAPPAPSAGQQAAQVGTQAYGTYQAGNQLANWAAPSTVSTPVSGSTVGAPISQTEAVLHGGDVASQSTPFVGGSSPVEAPAGWGTNAFASYGIPAAVLAATAMGANSANQSYQAGKEGGVMGGVKSGFNDPMDAATAFATGGLSIPANLAAGVWGGLQSGKDSDQRRRDEVRGNAVKSKWLDNNFQVPLESGNLDLSKDGGFRYTNAAGEERPVYNIDWNDPNAAQAVGWLQPLAAVLGKGDTKLTSDFTGQLYNELTKEGGSTDLGSLRKRIVELYNHFQLRPSIVAEAVNAMKLEQPVKDAYLAAVDNLRPGRDFQVKPGEKPSAPSMSDLSFGGKPKDTNMKPMGTGAVQQKPKPAQPVKPGLRGVFQRAA